MSKICQKCFFHLHACVECVDLFQVTLCSVECDDRMACRDLGS